MCRGGRACGNSQSNQSDSPRGAIRRSWRRLSAAVGSAVSEAGRTPTRSGHGCVWGVRRPARAPGGGSSKNNLKFAVLQARRWSGELQRRQVPCQPVHRGRSAVECSCVKKSVRAVQTSSWPAAEPSFASHSVLQAKNPRAGAGPVGVQQCGLDHAMKLYPAVSSAIAAVLLPYSEQRLTRASPAKNPTSIATCSNMKQHAKDCKNHAAKAKQDSARWLLGAPLVVFNVQYIRC